MTVSFEDVPYEGRPISTSRPESIAAEAWLRGIRAQHPARARVLELGCAEGANLIPHAYHCPDATFVGVDASPRHIEEATARRDALGLDNATFVCADIGALPPEAEGEWDYILCHGVYSWVPEPVRDAIFRTIGERLAPRGVGYVSYNVGPGWAMRGLVREVLLARTRGLAGPKEKLDEARELLQFIAETPFGEHHYMAYMAEEARALLGHRDAYIAHEYLTTENVSFRYGEIVASAGRHGLTFLAELSPIAHRSLEERMRAAVAQITDDPIEREELTDVLYGRAFRSSLFVREGVEVGDVEESTDRLLDLAGLVTQLRPTSRRPSLEDGDAEEFADPDDIRVGVKHPLLKAALLELARSFPVAVRFDDLAERAQALLRHRRVRPEGAALAAEERAALREDLMRLVGLRHLDFRLLWPEIVSTAGPRPRVSGLTRFESRREGWFTNTFHDSIALDDAARYLVDLMDGSRDRDELTLQLLATLAKHDVVVHGEDRKPLEGAAAREAMRLFVDRNVLILESQGVMER